MLPRHYEPTGAPSHALWANGTLQPAYRRRSREVGQAGRAGLVGIVWRLLTEALSVPHRQPGAGSRTCQAYGVRSNLRHVPSDEGARDLGKTRFNEVFGGVGIVWILSSENLVQSRKNARFHPNLMAHSLKNQAYFSPSHTLIRKISRRGAEFSHPIDAKPCWSPCPWTRSPSHAWPAKIRFALSLGYNVCMSWQKNPGTCSTKPFLRATQR